MGVGAEAGAGAGAGAGAAVGAGDGDGDGDGDGPEPGKEGLEGWVQHGTVGWLKVMRSLECAGWWRGTTSLGLNQTW